MKRKIVLLMILCALLLTGAANAQGVTVDRDSVFISALYNTDGKFLNSVWEDVSMGDASPTKAAEFEGVPDGASVKTFLLDAVTFAPYEPTPVSLAYAVLYDDGTFVFQSDAAPDYSRGGVTNTYEIDLLEHYTAYWDDEKEDNVFTVPWYDDRESIITIDFADIISPVSTAYWFYECSKLTEIKNIDRLDTSNVTDMSSMFCSCYHLTPLDVSNFDTSNVTDMSNMFAQCYDLTALDVSGWDTSNVTDMGYMFAFCRMLTEPDVSGWDTSNVTSMYQVFYACRGLKELDLSGWDTSNVTQIYQMFGYCENLTTIYASEKFVVNRDEDWYSDGMFSGCGLLVGGAGTVYDENHTDGEYARIDAPGTPGYFTAKK